MANRNTKIKMSQIYDIAPSDVTANSTNSPSTGQVPSKASGDEWTWVDTKHIEKTITQNSHGFSVKDVLMFDESTTQFVKAQADSEDNCKSTLGIVFEVVDTNNFKIVLLGYVTELSGLTAGKLYYLSASSAGTLTDTKPSTAGEFVKPVLVADTTSSGYVINQREIENVEGLFELDGSGDLMPVTNVGSDLYFELDGNDDITPKA